MDIALWFILGILAFFICIIGMQARSEGIRLFDRERFFLRESRRLQKEEKGIYQVIKNCPVREIKDGQTFYFTDHREVLDHIEFAHVFAWAHNGNVCLGLFEPFVITSEQKRYMSEKRSRNYTIPLIKKE